MYFASELIQLSPSIDRHVMVHNKLNKSHHVNHFFFWESYSLFFGTNFISIEESVNLSSSKVMFSQETSIDIGCEGNFLIEIY